MPASRPSVLAAVLLLLALAGCGGGDLDRPPATPRAETRPAAAREEPGEPRPVRLTLRQAVGQHMVFPYAGRTPPEGLVKRIRRGEAAGVILFARNVGSRKQARAAMRRLQRIQRPRGLRAPLLVVVDQEGGTVRRIPGAPRRGAAQIAAGGPQAARREGRAAARTLRSAGVNVDLAPVADVARRGSAMAREGRAFGSDPRTVSRLAAAFTSGLHDGGVAATAKHFPGFGAATVNTDEAPARIGAPLDTLRRVDGAPFRRLIDGGIEMVMLSTAVYPAVDPRPAAFSDRWVRGELRRRLGFGGVVVTDDLQTPAVARFGTPAQRAFYAVSAGVDVPLFAKDYRSAARAAEGLVRAVRAGRLDRAAVEAGARRVLALRGRLGERR